MRPLILALAVLSGQPGEVDQAQVEQIYGQAQEYVEQKNYDLALERFETLIEMFPEAEESKVIRESLILNILDVSRHAYNGTFNDDGSRRPEFLDRGFEQLRRYEADYEAAYGTSPRSPAVREAAQKLRDEANEEPYIGPCLSPIPPCLSPPPLEPRRGCGGESGGVASLVLLPFALRRRRTSMLEKVSCVLPPDVVARLRERSDEDEERGSDGP